MEWEWWGPHWLHRNWSRCLWTPAVMETNVVGLPRGCKRNAEMNMHFTASRLLQWIQFSWQLFLSLRFNGHLPGESGLAGIYWKADGGGGDSYKSCKQAPAKSSPPTNQHPFFYRPDALPVAQPTVSKHWRENITFHRLAYPKLTWGSSNFVSDH